MRCSILKDIFPAEVSADGLIKILNCETNVFNIITKVGL